MKQAKKEGRVSAWEVAVLCRTYVLRGLLPVHGLVVARKVVLNTTARKKRAVE
jgi:hypothetical protein